MSKLRQSAKGESCTFRIPGICNGDTATVVLCHAPLPDKVMGFKGPDTWAAYGCSSCHDYQDGRTSLAEKPATKLVFWFHAICETQRRMIKKGLLPK